MLCARVQDSLGKGTKNDFLFFLQFHDTESSLKHHFPSYAIEIGCRILAAHFPFFHCHSPGPDLFWAWHDRLQLFLVGGHCASSSRGPRPSSKEPKVERTNKKRLSMTQWVVKPPLILRGCVCMDFLHMVKGAFYPRVDRDRLDEPPTELSIPVKHMTWSTDIHSTLFDDSLVK